MFENLVSVVIPVYNVQEYLDRCLKSVTEQTYKNLEIILVDDGSFDKSPQICEAWKEKDSRIKVLHKRNGGAGTARNSGMQQAKGKYIFFFDSDDYVDKSIVQKCVDSAEKHGSDVVVFGHVTVYENGKRFERKMSKTNLLYKGESVKNLVLPSMFTHDLGFGVSPCKMYNLQTLKALGVSFESEREIASEDSIFNLEVFSKINTVSIVPQGLYFYFQRADSFSHTYNTDKQQKNNAYLMACLERARKAKLPKFVEYHIMARYHSFTLGGIMMLKKASIPSKEKKIRFKEIFADSVLRSTLIPQAIACNEFLPKIFWWCLKLRCNFLCYLFINLKAGK